MKRIGAIAALALAASALASCGLFDSIFMKTLAEPITAPTTTEAGTYTISGTLSVESVWTIEAGTVFKMDAGASISVAAGGQIVAKGVVDKPIAFTSSKTAKAKGDWGGISDAGNGSIYDYCVVEYAATGLEITGALATVTHCTFGSNTLGLDLGEAKSMKAFSLNAFKANVEPLYIAGTFNLDDSNVFEGNTNGYIYLDDNGIDADVSWNATTPIKVWYFRLYKTLTLGAGVRLQFEPDGWIVVEATGQLIADGTVERPVTFTSSKPVKVAGDWESLDIHGNGCALTNCVIEYAATGLNIYEACSVNVAGSIFRHNAVNINLNDTGSTVGAYTEE